MTAAYRAHILHFLDDPHHKGEEAWEYYEDGLLIIQEGKVQTVGPAEKLLATYSGAVHSFPHHIILPGLIDTHIHYPQAEMIASYGEQLLTWLERHTFPTEMQFACADHAQQVADFFIQELLRNGTTTALVFCTVHPESVNALFEAAHAFDLRMIAGKVLMDRNAPDELCEDLQESIEQTRTLIQRWHNHGRLQYAVTPRFALTSSEAQLQKAGELLQEFPDVYLHTHLSENKNEIAAVKAQFPDCEQYLDVYETAGLLTERSVFAHGVHLRESECQKLAKAGAAIAHCPTSNLFLGSGLLNLKRLQKHGVKIGLGTDVGAGTSFSLLRTMDEAYKVQQLRNHTLSPFQALYFATLGGARALNLEGKIGNFLSGNEADFIVLDFQATPLMRFRKPYCRTLEDVLFMINTLGDDRLIERTYALGRCVYQRP